MPAIDEITKTLWIYIQMIPGVVSMGIPGYILFGILAIGFCGFAIWLKKKADAQAMIDSQRDSQQDQAHNKDENQDIANQWDQAHSNIEDIRKENPDEGKIKR